MSDAGVVQKFTELVRDEFAGVVGMKRAEGACGLSFERRAVGIEFGRETLHAFQSITLLAQEVHKFESCVVIHEDERVAVSLAGG